MGSRKDSSTSRVLFLLFCRVGDPRGERHHLDRLRGQDFSFLFQIEIDPSSAFEIQCSRPPAMIIISPSGISVERARPKTEVPRSNGANIVTAPRLSKFTAASAKRFSLNRMGLLARTIAGDCCLPAQGAAQRTERPDSKGTQKCQYPHRHGSKADEFVVSRRRDVLVRRYVERNDPAEHQSHEEAILRAPLLVADCEISSDHRRRRERHQPSRLPPETK